MERGKTFLKYWLPVAVWMALIFSASADSRSAHRSSRLIEPVLRWLFPNLDAETVWLLVLAIRKCAHLTEYAVLVLLVWRALQRPRRADARPWSWRLAGFALLITALYAASDEIHQAFVPARQGRWYDVAIDTFGAAVALLALWTLRRWREGRRPVPLVTASGAPQTGSPPVRGAK